MSGILSKISWAESAVEDLQSAIEEDDLGLTTEENVIDVFLEFLRELYTDLAICKTSRIVFLNNCSSAMSRRSGGVVCSNRWAALVLNRRRQILT